MCVYGVLLLHIYFHGIVCNGDSVSSSLQKKDEDLKVEELVWICVRLELPLRLSFIVLLVMVRIRDISIRYFDWYRSDIGQNYRVGYRKKKNIHIHMI